MHYAWMLEDAQMQQLQTVHNVSPPFSLSLGRKSVWLKGDTEGQ